MVNISRFLQELCVHLGHSLHFDLKFLTEASLDCLFLAVVQSLLILAVLFDELVSAILHLLLLLLEVTVFSLLDLGDVGPALLLEITLALFLRDICMRRLNLMPQALFHILDLVVGFLLDLI